MNAGSALSANDVDNAHKNELAQIVATMQVVVCVGSGGVGKTTTAAALALYAGSIGKRALVITIDPARRLANSLGLDALSHAPKRLDPALLEQSGIPTNAPVDAMMLDLGAAWDDLVRRSHPTGSPSPELLNNPFYRHLSRDLAGGQDFVACEALYTLLEADRYDLIVLDTPPASNALDFLEAPARIVSFLDNDAFQAFYGHSHKNDSPGLAARLGLRFLEGASGAINAVLARFTGSSVLEDLGRFLGLVRNLFQPIRERTQAFQEVLFGPTCAFVIVTSPAEGPRQEAVSFRNLLAERGYEMGAAVVNRVTPEVPPAAMAMDAAGIKTCLSTLSVPSDVTEAAAQTLHKALLTQSAEAKRDQHSVTELQNELGLDLPLVAVPLLDTDVHDAKALGRLIPHLVASKQSQ